MRNSSEEDKEKLDAELFMLSAPLYHGEEYPFTSDNKMGLKDFLGGIIVPAIYDEIKLIKDNLGSWCGRIGNSWGKVVIYGEPVVSPIIEFDEPTHTSIYSHWTVVKNNGKYGVYDTSENKYLLEPIYDELIEK